jgi:hypothetical protein
MHASANAEDAHQLCSVEDVLKSCVLLPFNRLRRMSTRSLDIGLLTG